jgi:hypothetical protein
MANSINRKLHKLACEYGGRSLHWRGKFIGLLPELYERKVFEDYGFGSIFEYAAKLAGLSQQQVRDVLNLGVRVEPFPAMKQALVSGEVSVNKLMRVVSIATPENEAELVTLVKQLPKSAVEVMVRDFKIQNGLYKPKNEAKVLPGQDLGLSEEVVAKLLELQSKGLSINGLLLEFLQKREADLEAEKTAVADELPEAQSRYIPVNVRRVIQKEHGDKCSMPSCGRPSVDLHHTQRFSIVQRHDPRFIAPLCKNHHTLAHAVDVNVQEKRSKAQIPDYVLTL